MVMKDGGFLEGLTFDDVLLVPGKSSVLPAEVDTRTQFSRAIRLNIPLVSAAMDTVTESRLAIAIARQGGIGIIHRNMTIERQAEEVDRVKRSESGMIVDPVTISSDLTVRQATDIMAKYRISGLPVTRGTKLVDFDEPRFEVREEPGPARRKRDDQGKPGDRAGGDDSGRSGKDFAEAPH